MQTAREVYKMSVLHLTKTLTSLNRLVLYLTKMFEKLTKIKKKCVDFIFSLLILEKKHRLIMKSTILFW